MRTILAIVLFTVFISWSECPFYVTDGIGTNTFGTSRMPFDITLDFENPHLSFFRVNPYGNGQCFTFDISTDKGKQIYAMLLASTTQCRYLTIYTGDYINIPALQIEIKKLVLE